MVIGLWVPLWCSTMDHCHYQRRAAHLYIVFTGGRPLTHPPTYPLTQHVGAVTKTKHELEMIEQGSPKPVQLVGC